MANDESRYSKIIERIFSSRFHKGDSEVPFERTDLVSTASALDIALPKNLGDILYSFRYRTELPQKIAESAPDGFDWVIKPAGKAKYKFVLTREALILPNENMVKTKILDSTPGMVIRYSFDDEQALLAKIRYNRLIDIFTGITCYSLQNHLRTTVRNMGQIETDEIYVGVDVHGKQYIFPVQAKGGTDKIGTVQIEQDFAMCSDKFSGLICQPIAAQFLADGSIALFQLVMTSEGVRIGTERHYMLVKTDELSPEELEEYKKQSS